MEYNKLVFGKSPLERIVSCEINDDKTEIFIEEKDGTIRSEFKPNKFWLLSPVKFDRQCVPLLGNLYYKFIKMYDTREEFLTERKKLYKRDVYTVHDEKEAAMLAFGFTYYKGMKVDEVSVLAFDIEATSLGHDKNAKVLLISNTFRKNGVITRKLFSYDEYNSPAEMFDAWSAWVREVNPSIVIGHNIYVYDLPYMAYCASKAGTALNIGRDGSGIKFNTYSSQFRKDGSQSYEYNKAYIYGREIVDTMFLAYKYDFARKYENYRLKSIVKQEGLEVKNRVFYDADTIRDNYKDPVEFDKIKQYAIHDADDALALYDLMIPAYFYLTPSVPKSFTQIINSASGSQINSILVRSYLQDFNSIPKATEGNEYEGAISFGNPGIYKNVYKVDVASLYPSIMLQYEVHDRFKDPKRNFLEMVSYFTRERLENKKKGKETGDRYFKDLEQAQKIIINSAYGMMGAQGLHFNSPTNAAFVTRKGREILQSSIDWATANGFQIVNADTDSISITRSGEDMTPEDRQKVLTDINSLMAEKIRFEDDGYYPAVMVVKAKNYVLKDDKGKVKIKGSGLKGSMKEKALQRFMKEIIAVLLEGDRGAVLQIYYKYVKEIYNLTSIEDWCSKKTVTDKVLNPERTNEQNVLDAIGDTEVQEGDKIFVFFDKDGKLKLQENWTGDHDPERLVKKLYDTLKIFETVLDISVFPKFHLKAHEVKCKLAEVLGLPMPEKVKKTRKKVTNEAELHQATGEV